MHNHSLSSLSSSRRWRRIRPPACRRRPHRIAAFPGRERRLIARPAVSIPPPRCAIAPQLRRAPDVACGSPAALNAWAAGIIGGRGADGGGAQPPGLVAAGPIWPRPRSRTIPHRRRAIACLPRRRRARDGVHRSAPSTPHGGAGNSRPHPAPPAAMGADQALQLCLSLTRRIAEAAPEARHNKANVAQARGAACRATSDRSTVDVWPPAPRSRPRAGRSGIPIASSTHQVARRRRAHADARSDH